MRPELTADVIGYRIAASGAEDDHRARVPLALPSRVCEALPAGQTGRQDIGVGAGTGIDSRNQPRRIAPTTVDECYHTHIASTIAGEFGLIKRQRLTLNVFWRLDIDTFPRHIPASSRNTTWNEHLIFN